MLYREIIAVCSEIHINTLCGQNVEFVNVKLVIHIVTIGLNYIRRFSQYRTVNTPSRLQKPAS